MIIKHISSIAIIALLLISLPLLSQKNTVETIVGYWYYSDGYTYEQLVLKKNYKGHWYTSSCEGGLSFKGEYHIKNDSIILKDEKDIIRLKFYFKNDSLHIYDGTRGYYASSNPLTKGDKQRITKYDDNEIKLMEFKE